MRSHFKKNTRKIWEKNLGKFEIFFCLILRREKIWNWNQKKMKKRRKLQANKHLSPHYIRDWFCIILFDFWIYLIWFLIYLIWFYCNFEFWIFEFYVIWFYDGKREKFWALIDWLIASWEQNYEHFTRI